MIKHTGIRKCKTADKHLFLRLWRLRLLGLCLFVSSLLGLCPARAQLSQKGPFEITPLSDSVYVFTSYGSFKGQYYPANGLYVLTPKGAVIIDGPWDPKDRLPLLDSIRRRHHQKVVACLATHFHEDRSGALKQHGALGIPTYSTQMTDSLCQLHHMPRAKYLMAADTIFTLGGRVLETYYPGPGHAPDNIVVWLPKEKILYGGCFLKSVADSNLGNLGDADIQVWAENALKLKKRYPDPRYIIVGHGPWHSLRAIDHTIHLVNAARKKAQQ